MFERLSTKIFAGLALAGLFVAAFLFGYGAGREAERSTNPGFTLLREAEARISESSVSSTNQKQLLQGAIKGMVESLADPYAEFLDPATYRNFRQVTSGQFSGVGLWLKMEAKKAKVVSVLPRTPAERAGIQNGDLITTVDGKAIERLSLEQVVQRVQGQEGTQVKLAILRGEQSIEFILVRERIDVASVDSRMLRERIGLIEVATFTGNTSTKVREAVSSLSEKGARGFILDLRGNPGGLLEEAVDVASAFIEGGRIVSFKERDKSEVVFHSRPPVASSLPLVVMVDEGSASASEIVAAAVQDRGRGVIVGTATYGKGSVQTVFPLSDGSAIKLTTASYYAPSGRSIGEKGVTPDVSVADKSIQLVKAREILREMLAGVPEQRVG